MTGSIAHLPAAPARSAHTTVFARPTRAERVARGKAARARVPRSRHAELALSPHRDPLALLEEQAQTRIPELVPVRYGRMIDSPFSFYRGAALIMAADLSRTPTSGLFAQVGGDAHMANFGMFGTPERNHGFDMNDFDETLPGPWEWDVKRLATSFEIAGRADGFSPAARDRIVREVAQAYRTGMVDFAAWTNLDVWYARLDIDTAMAEYEKKLPPREMKRKRRAVVKALTRDSEHAFERLTRMEGRELHLVAHPPLIVPSSELWKGVERKRFEDVVLSMFEHYRASLPNDRRALLGQYRFVDIARKAVGVGSVGTRCWIALLLGADVRDPLFLQIKQAQASVLERFVGRSVYTNHGQRVIAGQRLMQSSSDIFLGWGHLEGHKGESHDYYFRQLRDWKGSFVIENMSPASMRVYAGICGWTLARAHARSGDRVAIAAYLGKGAEFDRAIAAFARAYADVNERDHATLAHAVRSGRVEAVEGI
jgi:uncharacterized protein (DUF2252 family)